VAVLAALYIVKPWSKLLADLTPQQQVQAAVLADMWQLPDVSAAAVEALKTAICCTDNLAAILNQLLRTVPLPDCLLPVFEHSWHVLLHDAIRSDLDFSEVPKCILSLLERVLLGIYGDLEAVWGPAGGTLQESLMRLPLHAMEMLLASDKLKVRGQLGCWAGQCSCSASGTFKMV
jgi:hypothetical protein